VLKLIAMALLSGTVANAAIELCKTGPNAFEIMPQLSVSAWAWLIYLAVICTVVGYALWYVVIRETEVNIAGLTVLMQPMAGWLLSVLWLKESVHSGQFWGAVAILAGLAIGLRNGPSTGAVSQPESEPEKLEIPLAK